MTIEIRRVLVDLVRLSFMLGVLLWIPWIQSSVAETAVSYHRLFYIDRNKNKNRVIYEIAVDEQCEFYGDKTIKIYWRMFERGSDEIEALNFFEQKWVYTVKYLSITHDMLRVSIKGLPQRTIRIEALVVDGLCQIRARTQIENVDAIFTHAYVCRKERSWLRPNYVNFYGHKLDRTRVFERLWLRGRSGDEKERLHKKAGCGRWV